MIRPQTSLDTTQASKDLHQAKDDGWLFEYPCLTETMAVGSIGIFGEGETLIISYANGYYLSRQASAILKQEHNIEVRIIDIRWLAPLPIEAIANEVKHSKRVLIVDEGRKTASISEAIITELLETLGSLPKMSRLTGQDTFIPLGDAWQYVLPSVEGIIGKVIELEK